MGSHVQQRAAPVERQPRAVPGHSGWEINLADGTYVNRLTVPPNDWLGARRADWTRVDDTLWLVTFGDVTVSVLGFDLFTKAFDGETTRDGALVRVGGAQGRPSGGTMEGLRREGARGRAAVAGGDDDCVFTGEGSGRAARGLIRQSI